MTQILNSKTKVDSLQRIKHQTESKRKSKRKHITHQLILNLFFPNEPCLSLNHCSKHLLDSHNRTGTSQHTILISQEEEI